MYDSFSYRSMDTKCEASCSYQHHKRTFYGLKLRVKNDEQGIAR